MEIWGTQVTRSSTTRIYLCVPPSRRTGVSWCSASSSKNVLALEDYVANNWKTIPSNIAGDGSITLTDNERRQLFAARMVGRFKSGVPLALSPYTEDRDFLAPAKINNFDYTETDGRCPFAAHIRKTDPRKLTPFIAKEYLDAPNPMLVGA